MTFASQSAAAVTPELRPCPLPPAQVPAPSASFDERPEARGKFLYLGDSKYWVKGVTYGTFGPGQDGQAYPDQGTVERDFAAMSANGINTVRTYTVPPRWLLDVARGNGLRVMVGVPWEQHIAFLDEASRRRSIERRVRAGVAACASHPALLCYAIGNEIPPSIVRWYGRRRIERFVRRLYDAAKEEAPSALVTYVNYPTTEYLQLPFLDLVCFNVYLETPDRLRAYLARVHNLAGDRPLLMSEIGLDSRRNGDVKQAESLAWQVRAAFASGCAGAFVFAWTDEWHRGGFDIEDWDFGLVTRNRQPKPALEAVRRTYAEVPFARSTVWPRISVVVCSYNGERTIRDTLEGLQRLDYPDYEVIVIDDGSTDSTPEIAAEFPVRLISTENRGLSSARNTGWQEANGEIVAYIDDDAYPDPHWLRYLAHIFLTTRHVGVGGPNLAPPGDGPIADCVANAPGGPVHVLLSDTEAEHIPGCNMAFRRSALEAIGGFDPRYRTAGDDVDLCWRLQQNGGTLGFHPAALVWHHRRNSLRLYWRQQQGYGKAEALLEGKWPERYNELGHLAWAGRLYGKGLTRALQARRWRIYHGTWGAALFQSLYEPAPATLLALPLMPEWYLLIVLLGLLSLFGALWSPLLWASPLFGAAAGACIVQAAISAAHASFTTAPLTRWERIKLQALTAFLHLLQPVARLKGRLRHGLTLWRKRGGGRVAIPIPRTDTAWYEHWQDATQRLAALEVAVSQLGAVVLRGGDYDRWDLAARGGALGSGRLRMAIEEHGAGRQLVRFRLWPRLSPWGIGVAVLFGALGGIALSDRAWLAGSLLLAMTVVLLLRMAYEAALACGCLTLGVRAVREDSKA